MTQNNFIMIPNSIEIKKFENNLRLSLANNSIFIPIHNTTSIELHNIELNTRISVVDSLNKNHKKTIEALIIKAIKGLTRGVTKTLNLIGTGFKANVKEDLLYLFVGLSHPLIILVPTDLKVSISNGNIINILGKSEVEVSTFANALRSLRKPNAYKGTGINTDADLMIPRRKTK